MSTTQESGALPRCRAPEQGPATIRGGGAVPAGLEAEARWVVAPQPGGLKGVLLHHDDETNRFDLVLVNGEGHVALRFEADDEDAVALWRGLGAATGAPLMLQGEDGRLETPYPQVGRLALGPSRVRRRHGLLNGRRPRFLVRRKPARLPNRPQVFREPEIVGSGAL